METKELLQRSLAEIKTFEDACKKLELDPEKCLPDVSTYRKKHRKALTAHAKLVIISEALNEGWTPDWDDSSEYKYQPWFKMSSSFGYGGCDYWNASSFCGSRLCFKSRELAEYAGKQFRDIYKYFLTL